MHSVRAVFTTLSMRSAVRTPCRNRHGLDAGRLQERRPRLRVQRVPIVDEMGRVEQKAHCRIEQVASDLRHASAVRVDSNPAMRTARDFSSMTSKTMRLVRFQERVGPHNLAARAPFLERQGLAHERHPPSLVVGEHDPRPTVFATSISRSTRTSSWTVVQRRSCENRCPTSFPIGRDTNPS